MRKTNLYAVYDNKAQDIHGGIFIYNRDEAAIRFFRDIATDEKTLVYKHPQDYDLLTLAEITIAMDGTIRVEPATKQCILTGEQLHAALTTEDNK